MSNNKSSAPGYKLTVGSREFEQSKSDALEYLLVEDHVDMVDVLTARIGGSEEQEEWNFKLGDAVECWVGKGDSPLFKGEVTAIEYSYQHEGVTQVTLRCLDKSHRLGRGRKTRYWENMKDSDVVAEVGSECGLSVDADPTDETLPYILQRNESNVAFLKRLAARNNYILRVEDGKLTFKKASFEGSSVKITLGDNLRSVRHLFNTTDQVQKVVVRGWDIKTKQEIVGEATADSVTKIGGGEVGAVTAGSAFGESTAYVTDVPVSSQAMANLIAKAEMERLARQFARGSCAVQGNDQIRAGTVVEFSGLSKGLNGTYYILSSRHTISSRTGYKTEFIFCSNTSGT